MPIPDFSVVDGLLPPYLGVDAAQNSGLMSPHRATVSEVVGKFSTSPERKSILAGWLMYRAALRSLGIVRGIEWLGGSFLEDKERLRGSPPDDIDIVLFLYRPNSVKALADWSALIHKNLSLFDQQSVKAAYHVHIFFVELDGDPETIVLTSQYYLQLFSHTRGSVWKGMLQVRLEDLNDDAILLSALQTTTAGTKP